MKIVFLLLTAAALCIPAVAQAQPSTLTPQISAEAPAPDTSATTPADPQSTPPAPAAAPSGPLQIKVGNAIFKFGILLQPQADFSQDATGHTAQNLLLRRTRFIVGGQVTNSVFFFFQTENSRLGNAGATKTISTGFQTVDAVAEWRISKPINIWAGLIYLPTSREALKGSSSEFMIDVNSYAFTATTALQGTAGRDTGVMLRGYFLGDHLEYRAGLFSGLRVANARNPYRFIGRVQYDVFDTEVYNLPSYTGNFYGTKKILAIGAAYDEQGSYKGPTADVFADIPIGIGSSNTTVTVMRLDGGSLVPTALPKSNIFVADTGVYIKGPKLGPWVRYEKRDFSNPNQSKDEKRYVVGLNWYPYLNNFNVKTGFGRFEPRVGKAQKQATIQLQFFYF
jgi:hypothetical protein